MADQLTTSGDLALIMQLASVDTATATLLIEVGTAIVQAAAGGQRIVGVTGDTFTLIGTTDSWLDLPQIPVSAVSSITIDGTTVTAGTDADDYKRIGNRLWRTNGWQTYCDIPSIVTGTYSHGYAAGRQELQLGRGSVLSIIRGAYDNPSGVLRESIDDYTVAYEEMSAQMEAAPHLKAAIRRQYGRRAGLVRIG